MKRILITGANSYVGTNVEKWLLKEPDKYHVETLDMKDPNWINFDFSKFDVVFHVAGIAHSTPKRSEKDLYYRINTQLTVDTAKKAKEAGVKQFIFMSSMIIYNKSERKIDFDTVPNPDNFYGNSKLKAENGLKEIEDERFKVAIVRPPMIYGFGSKGNFSRLLGLTKRTPVFPNISNKRSILYIDNLSLTIEYLIEYDLKGIYFPQNKETISTSQIVKIISAIYNKNIWFTRIFNPFIYVFTKFSITFNKLFSDSYYDQIMSNNLFELNYVSTEESLRKMVNHE